MKNSKKTKAILPILQEKNRAKNRLSEHSIKELFEMGSLIEQKKRGASLEKEIKETGSKKAIKSWEKKNKSNNQESSYHTCQQYAKNQTFKIKKSKQNNDE